MLYVRSRTGPKELIEQALPVSSWIDAKTIGAAPVAPGAYILLVGLRRMVAFERGHLSHRFGHGWYVYAGSARGPGGLRARIRRHLLTEKTVHWHVDSLTLAADFIEALAVEGASECDLAAMLLKTGKFRTSLAGFGSSDCRICSSHLLELGGSAG